MRKEEIKISFNTHNNGIKGPCFKIFVNDTLIDDQTNYMHESYEKTFTVTVHDKKNRIRLEHYNKSPKDTITQGGKVIKDIALELTDIRFNGVQCHIVDLHDNFFYVTDWPYQVESQQRNNLFFGFNGYYEYYFESPATKYVLEKRKEKAKDTFIIEKVEDTNIDPDTFMELLTNHLKEEII